MDRHRENCLLDIARESIRQGLSNGAMKQPDISCLHNQLQEQGASFITLKRSGNLRGCIGSLEPEEPLALDVANNAYRSAFQDPRFPSLGEDELDDLHLSISVLSSATAISFESEYHLIEQLEPGRDGLILICRTQRGTFLPSVWELLPDPQDFLRALKQKAGLPVEFWSDEILVSRYHTHSFGANFNQTG